MMVQYKKIVAGLLAIISVKPMWADGLKHASDLESYGVVKLHKITEYTTASGIMKEGGLLVMKTKPNAVIKYAGVDVRADMDGRAVLGFHRDEDAKINITINGVPAILTPIDGRYNIQHVNGVASKYVSPPDSVLKRIRQDVADAKSARKVLSPVLFYGKKWIAPVQSFRPIRITGVYGSQRVYNGVPKNPHYGIDFAVGVGTSLLAPMDGTIVLAKDMYYSGKTIIMDHGGGVFSSFLHLSKITVSVGDKIRIGQVMGETGNTGRSTGPHLDWRMNWRNKRIDPALLVGKQYP